MTTDKLTNALIAILEAAKPDADITVADARNLSEIDPPTIAVDVHDPERHSLAMPGVMKCPVHITLRANPGDGHTRETLKSWADAIERTINDPAAMKTAITISGIGIQCDYFHGGPGSTRWEETTFEASFSAEAWVVRTS